MVQIRFRLAKVAMREQVRGDAVVPRGGKRLECRAGREVVE
jgi:hypothetical protein